MALAVGCRPLYALLLACWLGWQFYQRRSLKRILPALLPAVVMAACMMAYNFARFGSVTESGHNYLPEFVRAENGQFSLTYLVPNLLQLLRPVTLDAQGQLSALRYTMDFCSLLPTRFSCWRWYADCCCACPGTRRRVQAEVFATAISGVVCCGDVPVNDLPDLYAPHIGRLAVWRTVYGRSFPVAVCMVPGAP